MSKCRICGEMEYQNGMCLKCFIIDRDVNIANIENCKKQLEELYGQKEKELQFKAEYMCRPFLDGKPVDFDYESSKSDSLPLDYPILPKKIVSKVILNNPRKIFVYSGKVSGLLKRLEELRFSFEKNIFSTIENQMAIDFMRAGLYK